MGEAETGPLRLRCDRSVKLSFRGSSISSDGDLLFHRELDKALGLTDTGAAVIADPRTGRNGRHRLATLVRQSTAGIHWEALKLWRKGLTIEPRPHRDAGHVPPAEEPAR